MEKVRGVWITNVDSDVLNSKPNITEAIKLLADTGFNSVFPVVWNRGYTLYPSPTMQKNFGMEIAPRFAGRDPLAEVVDAAHASGLKVIPWFEYGFAASYGGNGGHILKAKPDWAARDQKGKLLNKNGFDWMNAFHPEVQSFMLELLLEVVQNYDVDGIQGDDRLPALPSEGGYDEFTTQLYHAQFGALPPSNTKEKTWLQWRANLLTEFLARLCKLAKAINPNLMVSIAPSLYPFGFNEYLQDIPTWLKCGLVDLLHPQFYRRNLGAYRSLVNQLTNQFPNSLSIISPGVLAKFGSYAITPDLAWDCIRHNRHAGLRGEVLFFYEGLCANDQAVAKHLQAKHYAEYAILRRGHRGADVEAVQQQLKQQGFDPGVPDGTFGAKTERAVKAFQRTRKLIPIDGIVGPATLRSLLS